MLLLLHVTIPCFAAWTLAALFPHFLALPSLHPSTFFYTPSRFFNFASPCAHEPNPL